MPSQEEAYRAGFQNAFEKQGLTMPGSLAKGMGWLGRQLSRAGGGLEGKSVASLEELARLAARRARAARINVLSNPTVQSTLEKRTGNMAQQAANQKAVQQAQAATESAYRSVTGMRGQEGRLAANTALRGRRHTYDVLRQSRGQTEAARQRAVQIAQERAALADRIKALDSDLGASLMSTRNATQRGDELRQIAQYGIPSAGLGAGAIGYGLGSGRRDSARY